MEKIIERFNRSMDLLTAGLTIVTTEIEGRPWGLTVSACCRISSQEPLLMVSLLTKTAAAEAIGQQGKFGVSLLNFAQRDTANAGAKPGVPKFFEMYVSPHADGSTYLIKGALAHVHCSVEERFETGDHTLFVGRAEEVTMDDGNENSEMPLLYFNRQFGTFTGFR
ncbi:MULTISPECIES: flavin reductase family protein [unclassified Paenibacillus]|uniref:flavin reductase family protein n=1 Tax=unclassified Paenibacillus TaxID=185978 RepID=UPI00240690B7|nr:MULTISPECIES: flavin reductase family protein [unclassified Paenibacillus]MDF9845373.1 flavin reductase ActVB [Paenibacillus sp. PastF-2]MDF9851941.1 flavin reductase ActVB [Paenibacillus sp. PastM-2]MDF9858505.1 flavin reductase ActVB [Paenibacillus sp. PastF-1]MDH6483786.1 flavin reductase ActVB [Paenibacillus sp. PastH-2]MDH6511153.1 flavin reductase ActVB [Paenibacillus sp. PastM-3]